MPLDTFALEQLKEAFSHRIVVAVAATTQAGLKVVRLQEVLPVMIRELTALVRLRCAGRYRLSTAHRR